LSVEEVMEKFDVTREQIAAVLEFVAQSLDGRDPQDVRTTLEHPAGPQPGISSDRLRKSLGLDD